jgi:CRP/FNR family cyclic AMP-dependent transcriptional regulator
VVLEDRKEDRELTLAYPNPGDFIGDLGLFEKAPRSSWVRARTDCEIAEINYEHFHELSEEYPEFFRAINTQLARRLRDTTRKLGNLAFLDVTGRVTEALMDLCN